jgi:hypothetical protein
MRSLGLISLTAANRRALQGDWLVCPHGADDGVSEDSPVRGDDEEVGTRADAHAFLDWLRVSGGAGNLPI